MKFKVGDVVITKKCANHLSGPRGPRGAECTIISVDPDDRNGIVYETNIPCTLPGPWPYWWGCEGCFDFPVIARTKALLSQGQPQRERESV